MREGIRRKRPELWHAGNWLLHDDNAPSHRALVTHEFLTHNSIFTLPQPLYSLDLAPCDFFLFPKMKLQLKGRCFDGVEEIKRESQNALGRLPRPGLPARVPTVATTLGSVCRCTRELFWRRRCPNLNQVHTFYSIRDSLQTFWYPLVIVKPVDLTINV
jgi:transposase